MHEGNNMGIMTTLKKTYPRKEGRPGLAAQERERAKLWDGQREGPAGAHLRADTVHHEGDRLHHLARTKLWGDCRCRLWLHLSSPPVGRAAMGPASRGSQGCTCHEQFVTRTKYISPHLCVVKTLESWPHRGRHEPEGLQAGGVRAGHDCRERVPEAECVSQDASHHQHTWYAWP